MICPNCDGPLTEERSSGFEGYRCEKCGTWYYKCDKCGRAKGENTECVCWVHKIDEALQIVATEICDNLPENWRINLEFEEGCLDIILYDPDEGKEVKFDDEDSETTAAYMILRRINEARKRDGLEPVYDLERY